MQAMRDACMMGGIEAELPEVGRDTIEYRQLPPVLVLEAVLREYDYYRDAMVTVSNDFKERGYLLDSFDHREDHRPLRIPGIFRFRRGSRLERGCEAGYRLPMPRVSSSQAFRSYPPLVSDHCAETMSALWYWRMCIPLDSCFTSDREKKTNGYVQ